MKNKILIVRKMSAFEYYYDGNHKSKELLESHEEQRESVQKVLKRLDDNNFIYDVITRKDLSENRVNQYDFIFSLGGDGTVIATAAFNKNKPQLNIRTDEKSVGALCSQNTDYALDCFFNRDYSIDQWTRQDVSINSQIIGRALNETCVGESGMKFTKVAKYNMNEEVHKNSGLIIVTGTGSTGWPSAFESYSRNSKEFKFRTMLPLQGHESGQCGYIKLEYMGHEGGVALDTIEHKLPRDSILEIKVSEHPLRVITTKNEN